MSHPQISIQYRGLEIASGRSGVFHRFTVTDSHTGQTREVLLYRDVSIKELVQANYGCDCDSMVKQIGPEFIRQKFEAGNVNLDESGPLELDLHFQDFDKPTK